MVAQSVGAILGAGILRILVPAEPALVRGIIMVLENFIVLKCNIRFCWSGLHLC